MKDDAAEKRQEVLRLLLEACYALSLFLAPLAPRAATFALRRVGGQPMATSLLKADFSNLQTGAPVTPGAPLFAQIEVDGGASAALAKEKKKKVAGFPSHGMVLCATAPDGSLSCVDPPKSAKPGDVVLLKGLTNPAASDSQVDKKKLFAKAQPHFAVRGNVCYYKDKPFDINGAACTAAVADG